MTAPQPVLRLCSLLLLFGLLAGWTSQAAPRLAIVAENPAAAPAAELLTAELSRNPAVQLLERAELDRIYREQQLAAANNDYLKLGQVLGAEGLLLLDAVTEGTNRLLDLKFVAVHPGVVLAREHFKLALGNDPEWAAGLSRHLAPLLPKASVLVKEAVPLSIVGLRSAVQSAAGRDLERQLTWLLIQRLEQQREVFVLERRNLQVLAGEKQLQGMAESAFWNGSFLLEGTLDRDGYSPQTLTINARLVPPHGGAPQALDLSCSRTNLGEGAARLADQLLAALKLKPSANPWNSAEEAEQFFADATWAYRWGLLAQAQAASESAWALGKHTEPLARLRIRAYTDDVWPIHDYSGNIEIPGLPEPAKLKPLLRALELFGQDSPSVSTNAGRLDEQWYLNGLRLFRESAAMLDGFHHWAELSAAYATQLADTRAETRRLLALLETNAPMERPALQARLQHGRFGPPGLERELQMFDLVKWNEGGLLFERPEDSLPLYRSMLAQGYAPSDLPRLVGWTWEQRKSVPRVTRQFIEELCASTNPPLRLAGLTLAVVKTPFYPEVDFHEKEAALVAALWEQRAWLIGSAEHAARLERIEEVLRRAYGDMDPNRYFPREPFAGTRYRLEKEFLLSATNFDYWRFQAIFPRAYQQMPPAQARDLALALEPLTTNRMAGYIRDELRSLGGLAVATNAPPASPALPPEEPLTARFIPWKLAGSRNGADEHPRFEHIRPRSGRLWSLVAFVPRYAQSFAFQTPKLFVAVDPQTGSCEQIQFPETLGQPDDSLEVTPDALYVSVQDHLARYRFANRAWDTIPVPLEGGAELLAVGGRLYLANASTLLELDPETLHTRVVASARRRPSVNELDSLLSSSTYLYERRDGKLGVMASDHVLLFAGATHALKETSSVPQALLRGFGMPLFSTDGMLLRTADMMKNQLTAFWNDQPAMELLLQQVSSRPGRPPLARPEEPPPASARWEWPPAFDLGASCILANGTNLWVLTPRKQWDGMGIGFRESVHFSDARQATLFRFEAKARRPVSIPITFEKTAVEPFNPDQGGYAFMAYGMRRGRQVPFWLETPAGLVFSAPALEGHWFIPKAALEARLASLRTKNQTLAPQP